MRERDDMKWIRYVGLSHARIITAADWRSVGIAAETVAWTAQNGFAVPADTLTDTQMEKAITPDPEFIVTDEDFTPTPMGRDMTPAQVVQLNEAPVDVLGMLDGAPDASTARTEASGAPDNITTDTPARKSR